MNIRWEVEAWSDLLTYNFHRQLGVWQGFMQHHRWKGGQQVIDVVFWVKAWGHSTYCNMGNRGCEESLGFQFVGPQTSWRPQVANVWRALNWGFPTVPICMGLASIGLQILTYQSKSCKHCISFVAHCIYHWDHAWEECQLQPAHLGQFAHKWEKCRYYTKDKYIVLPWRRWSLNHSSQHWITMWTLIILIYAQMQIVTTYTGQMRT